MEIDWHVFMKLPQYAAFVAGCRSNPIMTWPGVEILYSLTALVS